MDDNKAIQDLFQTWKLAYPDRKPKDCQNEAYEFWNKIKLEPDFKEQLEEKMQYLQLKILKIKQKSLAAWVKVSLFNIL